MRVVISFTIQHKAFSQEKKKKKHHKLTKDTEVSAAIPTDFRAASFSKLWYSWFYHQHTTVNKLFTHVVLHGTHILTFKLITHITLVLHTLYIFSVYCVLVLYNSIPCIYSFFVLLFCLFYCVILFNILFKHFHSCRFKQQCRTVKTTVNNHQTKAESLSVGPSEDFFGSFCYPIDLIQLARLTKQILNLHFQAWNFHVPDDLL